MLASWAARLSSSSFNLSSRAAPPTRTRRGPRPARPTVRCLHAAGPRAAVPWRLSGRNGTRSVERPLLGLPGWRGEASDSPPPPSLRRARAARRVVPSARSRFYFHFRTSDARFASPGARLRGSHARLFRNGRRWAHWAPSTVAHTAAGLGGPGPPAN